MKRTEKQFGIILPLNLDGRIMCATCHNPHEKGVMPDERGAAGGAGEKDRIRLACHKDKDLFKGAASKDIYKMR